jgi:lactoylglutathione lyase
VPNTKSREEHRLLHHHNKLGLKRIVEMYCSDATNYFFAFEANHSQPMLEITHNHGRTEPYEKGTGYSQVAFLVDDMEETVAKLKEQG